jgi:hypothetical protein
MSTSKLEKISDVFGGEKCESYNKFGKEGKLQHESVHQRVGAAETCTPRQQEPQI